MKTVALRYNDKFAPLDGTIKLHNDIISEKGYVWYGKSGAIIRMDNIDFNPKDKTCKVLLISDGKRELYWATVSEIHFTVSDKEAVPAYYRKLCNNYKVWLKIISFTPVEAYILSKCKLQFKDKTLEELFSKTCSSTQVYIEVEV